MKPLGRLLITGGNGHLGRHLVEGLLPLFSDIILNSRKGAPHSGHSTNLSFRQADITDPAAVGRMFSELQPDYVIHAAALKNIAYAESHPLECIKTNVYGSEIIAQAAIENKCKAVIGISSTRAALPVMGMYAMSKSVMERLFHYFNESHVHFMSLRLGNLAWSPGSVLSEWEQMLHSSGCIQTRGFDMSRFFLNINDAISFLKIICTDPEKFSGYTVVPQMKMAKIEDVLKKFISKYGGKYEQVPSEIPEKKTDQLVGEAEERWATVMRLQGQQFFLIRPGVNGSGNISFETTHMRESEIEEMIIKRPEKYKYI